MTEEAKTLRHGSRDAARRGRIRRTVVCCLAPVAALALASPAMASDVSVNGTTLQIDGDANSDLINLSTNGTTLTVVDTGTGGVTTGDADCTQVNPTTVTCPATLPGQDPVDHFEVNLDDGNDSFTNQNLVTPFGHVHSDAGGGGPATGVKTIVGGPGGQLLQGGLANDNIQGGDGDDQLEDGGGRDTGETGGNDVLNGGPGVDSSFYFRSANVQISADNVANDGQAGETDNVLVENLTTGDGNDVLVGDDSPNLFVASAGNDTLVGAGGNDELFGDAATIGGILARRGIGSIGSGNDTLDGGDGRDLLDCGPGFDLALHEPLDDVENNCERTGAQVVGDSAQLRGKKKNKFKAELLCPDTEGEPCSGKLKVRAGGKKIGKGKFSVGVGKTQGANAKLTKKGLKTVRRAGGSLLVTVEATTNEPGGTIVDEGTILVHR